MNDLEIAISPRSEESDRAWRIAEYLENVSVNDFLKHMEDIKTKAAGSTEAGIIKQKLKELLDGI